jgi:hypothetical protein
VFEGELAMTTESLEDRVRHLEDTEAIRVLMARYHQLCDGWTEEGTHKDPEALSQLFTEDGTWAVGPTPMVGRAAVAEQARRLQKAIPWIIHTFTNPVVSISGDQASGEFKGLVRVRREGRTSPGETIGVYRAQLVRQDAGWLFQSLTWERVHAQD